MRSVVYLVLVIIHAAHVMSLQQSCCSSFQLPLGTSCSRHPLSMKLPSVYLSLTWQAVRRCRCTVVISLNAKDANVSCTSSKPFHVELLDISSIYIAHAYPSASAMKSLGASILIISRTGIACMHAQIVHRLNPK